jgi:nucleoside-diphosphate-sugar epimerase
LENAHCLVTGASGFVGAPLVAALAQRGFTVDAVCHRRPPPAAASRVQCLDLGDDDASVDFSGIDTAYHLAGIAHQDADAATYRRVNLEATLRLAAQASQAGVRRFVFVSSVKAQALDDPSSRGRSAPAALMGDHDGARAARSPEVPGAAPASTLDYAASKWWAEDGLKRLCADGAMQLLILRPALIYSDDAPGHLALLRRWTAMRLPRPPVGGCRSMIARDDLVRLLVCLASVPLARPVHEMIVTDGQCYSVRRLHAALCRATGRRPLLPSPPAGLWRFACDFADRRRGRQPGSTWLRLAGDERYSAAGLEDCDFQPRLSFEDSLGLRTP